MSLEYGSYIPPQEQDSISPQEAAKPLKTSWEIKDVESALDELKQLVGKEILISNPQADKETKLGVLSSADDAELVFASGERIPLKDIKYIYANMPSEELNRLARANEVFRPKAR